MIKYEGIQSEREGGGERERARARARRAPVLRGREIHRKLLFTQEIITYTGICCFVLRGREGERVTRRAHAEGGREKGREGERMRKTE